MNRTIAWLVTLGFATAATCLAADHPLPRLPLPARPVFKQKQVEKDDKKAEKDEKKLEKDEKKPEKDEKEDAKEKNGKTDAPAAKSPGNLWPANPFPPAAPAVLDPRTGAWEQVYGPAGVDAGDHAIVPPPGPDGICPTPGISHPPLPAPTPLLPVSAKMPASQPLTTPPLLVPTTHVLQAPPASGRQGWFNWVDVLRKRPASERRQPSRERTLNISKNLETGSWEIQEMHKPR